MAEGFEWTIFEILEIIVAVGLFLIIGVAILFISDVNYLKAQVISIETSYTASLISGKSGKVELNYPDIEDINLYVNSNSIDVSIKGKDKFKLSKKYIGNKKVEIKKENNKITIVSNG